MDARTMRIDMLLEKLHMLESAMVWEIASELLTEERFAFYIEQRADIIEAGP